MVHTAAPFENILPAYTAPLIPTPPVTTKVPVVCDRAAVPAVSCNGRFVADPRAVTDCRVEVRLTCTLPVAVVI